MAVANLCRPGNATADIVLSLGLGLTVLVAVALVEGNLRRSVAAALPEDAPAFFFVGVEADRIEPFAETVSGIEGAGRFRSVPFLRGRIVRVNGLDPEQALVRDEHAWLIQGDRGLSYATLPPDNPTVAGAWWPGDYAGPPLLSVDADVIDAFDLALGDTITLNVLGREIRAEIRHVREVEWQGMQINFALLLSPEPLRHAPHGYVATVGATAAAEARIERTLAREFPQVTVVRVREALGRIAELMGSIAAAARSVGAVTLLAGALVLAGAVAAGHRRRTYESVVLKVLGVRRRDVVLIHAAEFALLGVLTGAIAAAAGTVTAFGVTTWVLEQDWVFLPGVAAGATGFCVLLTLGLGLFGTWRALGEPASPPPEERVGARTGRPARSGGARRRAGQADGGHGGPGGAPRRWQGPAVLPGAEAHENGAGAGRQWPRRAGWGASTMARTGRPALGQRRTKRGPRRPPATVMRR